MNDTSSQAQTNRVECPAAKDPAVRMFILAVMLIGFAIYCFVDKEDPPAAWDLEHINQTASYVLHVYGPYAFGAPGAAALIWAVVFLRRRLIADEEGIGYARGEKIPWSKIEKLDAGKLESKGILSLHHSGGKKLKLDSWKLQNFKDLVRIVEDHIPAKGGQRADQAD